MPTSNPRINVTLPKKYAGLVSAYAKSEEKSLSAAALDLILRGLETEEDMYYGELSKERLKDPRPSISHEEFWKE
jgi:hypothetical protein